MTPWHLVKPLHNVDDNILNKMLDWPDVWSHTHSSKAEILKSQCLRHLQKDSGKNQLHMLHRVVNTICKSSEAALGVAGPGTAMAPAHTFLCTYIQQELIYENGLSLWDNINNPCILYQMSY